MALSYLHKNDIIHRDIKAANILVSENGDIKLCDFGVAGHLGKNMRRNTFVGTPYWMAPEVIKQDVYDYKADIWSFGITAYEIAHGNPPYANMEPSKVIQMISKNEPPLLSEELFSKPLIELMENCLKIDPEERLSADDLMKLKYIKNYKKTTKDISEFVASYYQQIDLSSDEECGINQSKRDESVASKWNFDSFTFVRKDCEDNIFDGFDTVKPLKKVEDKKCDMSTQIEEPEKESKNVDETSYQDVLLKQRVGSTLSLYSCPLIDEESKTSLRSTRSVLSFSSAPDLIHYSAATPRRSSSRLSLYSDAGDDSSAKKTKSKHVGSNSLNDLEVFSSKQERLREMTWAIRTPENLSVLNLPVSLKEEDFKDNSYQIIKDNLEAKLRSFFQISPTSQTFKHFDQNLDDELILASQISIPQPASFTSNKDCLDHLEMSKNSILEKLKVINNILQK